MCPRYAIYYAPPADHPLWHLGCAWLGRNPETGAEMARPALGLPAAEIAAITGDPARYGFHATLKPPFRLAERRTAAELTEAVAEFAQRRPAFLAPPVRVTAIGGFRALTLCAPCPALDRLAADAVIELDGFRAPPTDEERAKRQAVGLSPAQMRNLDRWGYPYVLDQFRFHLTLTNPLPEGAAMVDATLTDLFGPYRDLPLPVPDIALYVQESPSGHFRLIRRFPLAPCPPDG